MRKEYPYFPSDEDIVCVTEADACGVDAKDLFEFKRPDFDLPEKARIFSTVVCEECGEGWRSML